MAKSIYPTNNADFLAWLENFINVANVNLAALGLTAADITALEGLQSDLQNKVNDSVAKREAAVASTTAMKDSRAVANEQISSYNRIFKATKTIEASLLEALGLNANQDSFTPIIPVAPTDLVVEGHSNGINYLKFNRNGNKQTVNFIIEAKIGSAAEYSFVTVTRKTRYEHKNQTPGVRVLYRVKAVNGGLESAYSNEAIVYNNGN